jgi:hypothetical protein
MSGTKTVDELAYQQDEKILYEDEIPQQPKQVLHMPTWLTADSPDYPVERNLDHALNFNNSLAMARIIRGLEGIFGSLNKAIIDIAMGTLELLKSRKAGKHGNVSSNAGVSKMDISGGNGGSGF